MINIILKIDIYHFLDNTKEIILSLINGKCLSRSVFILKIYFDFILRIKFLRF